jgi:hypothetical protein
MSEVKRPMKRYKVWKEDGPVGWSAVTDAEPGDILILASCFDELQAENAELREVLNEMKLCYVPPEFRDRIDAALEDTHE